MYEKYYGLRGTKRRSEILQFLGHNSDKYNGHSLRIGAATSVASKIEDHLIKVRINKLEIDN